MKNRYVILALIVFSIMTNLMVIAMIKGFTQAQADAESESKCIARYISYGVERKNIRTNSGTCEVINL